MSIRIETVRTNEFEMEFFRFGRGEKKMVILPGLSIRSVMPFAEAVSVAYSVMQNDFTVFVFDRRRVLPPTYSIREMASDTALALDALDLKNVYLFGASQGGMIAFELAAQRPDAVEKLAIASTALCMTETRFEPIRGWIEKAKVMDGTGLTLQFGQTVYPTEIYEKNKLMLAEEGESVTEEELSRFIILAQALQAFDVRFVARAVRCPIFAVGSRDDRIFGEAAVREIEELFRDRAGFEYHLYDGYGHAVYDTAPDFKERLHTFFMK